MLFSYVPALPTNHLVDVCKNIDASNWVVRSESEYRRVDCFIL